MTKALLLCIFFSGMLLNVGRAQSVAINANGSLPDSSALLDLKSTTKGLLIPRMLQSERDAISHPAAGLLLWQTDNTPGIYYNAGTPAAASWKMLRPAIKPEYAYYTMSNSSVVAPGGNIPFFNIQTATDGIIQTGPGTFVIQSGGTYKIDFIVSSSGAGRVGIALNGYSAHQFGTNVNSAVSQIIGTTILDAVSGDIISLVNASSSALFLSPTGSFGEVATLIITKLN